jgi:uncharacterized membrane protein YphA (DoxX/SURF4 family)
MTRSFLFNRWVLLGARLLVGGIFLVAGLDKIVAVGAFADAVRSYHILPPSLVLPFALAVPPIEILIGIYLLLGFQVRLAALGSILFLSMFIVALGRALILGDTDHACGCFGEGGTVNPILAFLTGGSTITPWDVIRDLILVALSGLSFVGGAGACSIGRLLSWNRSALSPHERTSSTDRPLLGSRDSSRRPPADQSY